MSREQEKTVPTTIAEQMSARLKLFHDNFNLYSKEEEITILSEVLFESGDGTFYGFYAITDQKNQKQYTGIEVPSTTKNIYYDEEVIVQPATETGKAYMLKNKIKGVQESTQLEVEELINGSIYLSDYATGDVYVIDSTGEIITI